MIIITISLISCGDLGTGPDPDNENEEQESEPPHLQCFGGCDPVNGIPVDGG